MNATREEIAVTFVGPQSEIERLCEFFASSSICLKETAVPTNDSVLPFTFEEMNALVLALGGAGIFAAAAKCLVSYLKERKRKLTIHTGKGNCKIITENFTPEEVCKLLKGLPPQSIAVIATDRKTRES